MFEIFTPRARRVIFFGRYEASQTGSTTIETEHLLLALTRENVNLFDKIPNVKSQAFRDELFKGPCGPPTSAAIDLPLSPSAKRVLEHAVKEHKALRDQSITAGHLLLGILSEVDSPSAKLLAKYGITREHVIEKMKQEPQEEWYSSHAKPPEAPVHSPVRHSVSQDDTATLVEESVYDHAGHTFTSTTRFRTSADGRRVNVSFQIRGPSGAHEFETEFDMPPETTGAGT
jgi:ATP-dependent Clp protease ATP-binding subunit ClpA